MAIALPSFWVTHLAKVLSGYQPCQRPLYLFSRGADKRPRDNAGDMAKWRADHSAQLQTLEDDAREKGWSVRKEQWIQVKGQFAAIKGKADLICQQEGKRPLIVDAKGGKPHDADVTQVLIYQILTPLAWKSPQLNFNGAVVYADDTRVTTTHSQAEELKPKLFALVKRLATLEVAPEPNPSRQSCLYCDVTDADCGQRWTEEDGFGTTEDF